KQNRYTMEFLGRVVNTAVLLPGNFQKNPPKTLRCNALFEKPCLSVPNRQVINNTFFALYPFLRLLFISFPSLFLFHPIPSVIPGILGGGKITKSKQKKNHKKRNKTEPKKTQKGGKPKNKAESVPPNAVNRTNPTLKVKKVGKNR